MTASRTAFAGRGQDASGSAEEARSRRWLVAGLIAFAVSFGYYLAYLLSHRQGAWMAPVDIKVYRAGGLIVLHHKPDYNGRLASPLYDWKGLFGTLKFTYTPFAALAFAVLALFPLSVLLKLTLAVNVAAMIAAIWFTLGGLGQRDQRSRLGGTLLLAAPLLFSEPVQRVLWLGQIELVLMALIMWDMCQPDDRRWKGIGVGIAAGIKLVPGIFIAYLLLTRRFRQAAVAAGTFAATVLIGFAALPGDSVPYWFRGVFFQGGRTGFVGWVGNQSLEAMITRFAGSVAAGRLGWLIAAVVVIAIGLAAAVVWERAGHEVIGVLTVALAGILASPISWDHHWVWLVPGVTVMASYAARAAGARRWWLLGLTALTLAAYAAWPSYFFGERADLGSFSMGLIFLAPGTNIADYYKYGDQPWFLEYHWRGWQLIAGNMFVLAGLALLLLAGVLAVRLVLRARREGRPLFEAARRVAPAA